MVKFKVNEFMESEIDNVASLSGSLEIPVKFKELDAASRLSDAVGSLEQIRQQRGEEVPAVLMDLVNSSIDEAQETVRPVGYHDFSHPLDFATSLIAQSNAVLELISQNDDAKLMDFIRGRMGGEYATPEFLQNLKETFTVSRVLSAAAVSLLHDREELNGKSGHEQNAVKSVQVSIEGLRNAYLGLGSEIPSGAEEVLSQLRKDVEPVILSTRYNLQKPGFINNDWETLDKNYDSTTLLLSRIAFSSDYVDKLTDPNYFSLEYTELLDRLDTITVEDVKDYPLLLLAAENYRAGLFVNGVFPPSIPSFLIARGFIDDTLSRNQSSLQLLENASSRAVSSNLKERFRQKGFNETSVAQVREMIVNPGQNAKLTELIVRVSAMLSGTPVANLPETITKEVDLQKRLLEETKKLFEIEHSGFISLPTDDEATRQENHRQWVSFCLKPEVQRAVFKKMQEVTTSAQ